jgi:hypothetical protein
LTATGIRELRKVPRFQKGTIVSFMQKNTNSNVEGAIHESLLKDVLKGSP